MLKFFEDAIANSPSDLKYWPLYMYHFTDIINAVSILKQGKIFSRKQALELKLMEVDNASHEVIDQTRDFVEEYVRSQKIGKMEEIKTILDGLCDKHGDRENLDLRYDLEEVVHEYYFR